MAFMRQSKFRHVFGKAEKKESCYDGIRISRNSWESTYCAVNPKFVAIITEAAGGGAFLVLPLSKVGRVAPDHPMVAGHKSAVLDVQWCPHDDNLVASCGEDCTVKLWQIPDTGLTTHMTEPVLDIQAHEKRVGLIAWHPSAQHVLVSSGSDNKMFFWNLGTGDAILEIDLPDQVWSMSFNPDGSRLVCSAKDKKVRIIDTHTGNFLQETQAHDGSKPAQACYLKDGKIFTTGFSRMSARQYALWDEKDLSEPMTREEIDNSNGVIFIFYDPDLSMVYLAGKGDSLIRYYEVTDQAPYIHYLSLYSSNTPQRGMGYMTKRGVDVGNNEIARLYKLHNKGMCEPIRFTVPRKSELFQDDLFPNTASEEAAITAEEFAAGKNAMPVMMSLKEGRQTSARKQLKVERRSHVLEKAPTRSSTSQAANDTAPDTALPPGLPADFDAASLMGEVSELRSLLKAQDSRICDLESRLAELETTSAREDSPAAGDNDED